MKYLLDTINIKTIEKAIEYLPVSGVTSNPSIVKKEGNIQFFEHMKQIRQIIGKEQSLHIQVTAADAAGMLKEAEALLAKIDKEVYIKVPVHRVGLRVIKALKAQGIHVTATAIYTTHQGLLAMEAGADFIAPYYNRMENMNLNPEETISTFAQMIECYGYSTQVVAASFKNIGQVNKAFRAGAQAATVDPLLLESALEMPAIAQAVDDFSRDWQSIYGGRLIADL